MKFAHVTVGNQETITAYIDGELYTATSTHPNWSTIKERCQSGTARPSDFDVEAAVLDYLSGSDRVSVANGIVHFDGDEVHSSLADRILEWMRDGIDYSPLVRFMEKVTSNPNATSRDALFDWIEKAGLCLTAEGDVVGYKSLNSKGGYVYSVTSGQAFVNGTLQKGNIKQKPGDVVTMPRAQVTFDPLNSCAAGLHVGTFEHAKNFSGDSLHVVCVNPRDVVSVPSHDTTKMRVCRYVLGNVVREPLKANEVAKPLDALPALYRKLFNPSFLLSAEWNDATQDLTIYFKHGKVITYRQVPQEVVREFYDARSQGWFYNEFIKGRYQAKY